MVSGVSTGEKSVLSREMKGDFLHVACSDSALQSGMKEVVILLLQNYRKSALQIKGVLITMTFPRRASISSSCYCPSQALQEFQQDIRKVCPLSWCG